MGVKSTKRQGQVNAEMSKVAVPRWSTRGRSVSTESRDKISNSAEETNIFAMWYLKKKKRFLSGSNDFYVVNLSPGAGVSKSSPGGPAGLRRFPAAAHLIQMNDLHRSSSRSAGVC